ncbi:MAG: class I SAM-dependent methyltransferase family protein [Candidatus Bathyarchaeota archaeon]|nr:class I SAM-dependent methyltransferase family protein [Candidatus Bathyarchaeota archaeon]
MKGDLRALLRGKLTERELDLVFKSYDVIGDIAVIRIQEQLVHQSEEIADALLHQKNIKAVWRQSSPIHGDYRLRTLQWVAGEKRAITTHKEHGSLFKVDVEKCYFSPRLAFERIRIAKLIKDNEIIVNMYAGVGCYSITIAKHSKAAKIYSIDINPIAVRYMRENVLLNRIVGRVFPIEGDANEIVEEALRRIADRTLMPLPERAYSYLDHALSSIKPRGGWIHYYDFQHANKMEDPVEKGKARVAEKLREKNIDFELSLGRIVRQTGPNWYQVALDIQING